jgi:ParB-like chromosome segregation protein Spo0J
MDALTINYLNIDVIKPYQKNARKNDKAVDKVAASIKEFGFKNPIIVDSNMEIIAGHTRYKAAKKLKLKKVPVIQSNDLTDNQVKAFRIADNKVGEIADWDMDLLLEEITELKLNDYNLELTGFDLDEINKMMPNNEVEEDDFDVDAAINDIENPVTKRGDIWQLGKHRLMCGDSTNKDCDVIIKRWEKFTGNKAVLIEEGV